MNGIKVNGEFLDLFPDTSFNLVLNNPIYSEGNIIPGDYSLPIQVPSDKESPKNSRLLQNPSIIENVGTKRVFKNVTHFFDHCKVAKGDLNVTDFDGHVNANFIFGFNAISKDFKTAKIRDICSENILIANNSYTKRVDVIFRTNLFSGPFSITINERVYTASTHSALATAINADTTAPRASATYHATPHSIYGTDSSDFVTIMPFSNPNDITSEFRVIVEDYEKIITIAKDFEDEYNNPIIAWLNSNFYSATPANTKMYLPMIKNGKMYEPGVKNRFGSATGQDFGFLNAVYIGTGFSLNVPYDIDNAGNVRATPFNRTSIAPVVRVKYVVEKIAQHFNVGLEGNFLDDPDFEVAFFYHSNSLDQRVPFLGNVDWLACRRTFNLNEFLPDMSAVDLLKNLQTRFNLIVRYNEKTGNIRIQKRDPVIAARTYKDITDNVSPSTRIELNNAINVRLETTKDTEDLMAVDDFYESGPQPDLIIHTDISRIPAQQSVNITGQVYDLPVSQRLLSTKIPMVFGFYAWRTTGFHNYPTANVNLSDGAFLFQGIDGIAKQRWPNYIAFLLKRKRLSFKALLPLGFITSLDWEQKVMIDRVKYLIEKIEVPFTQNGIGVADVTVFKS